MAGKHHISVFRITGIFILLWLCCEVHKGYAQKPAADSLIKLLEKTRDPVKRINISLDLAYELYDFNDSIALVYSQKALQEAKIVSYQIGIKRAYCYIGLGYYSKGEFDTSLKFLRQSMNIISPVSTEITVYNFALMGNTFRNRGIYDSAIYYYKKGLASVRNQDDPVAKLAIYGNLAIMYVILWDNDQALENLKEAEKILLVRKDKKFEMINIFSVFGKVYENMLQYDKSQKYYDKVCELAEKNKDYFNLINCMINNAGLSFRRGDLILALEGYFKILNILEVYNYPPQAAEIYIKMGETYTELSQFKMSSEYLYRALKISERYNLQYETAQVLADLAWINDEEQNFPLAMDYINRSEGLFRKIGVTNGIAKCQNTRGLIYYFQQKNDSAVSEFNASIASATKIGNRQFISDATFNLSLVYERQGEFNKALLLREDAMKLEEEVNNKQGIALCYNYISRLLTKMGKSTEAESYLVRAANYAQKTKSKVMERDNYGNFALFYAAKGDYQKAFKYQQKYQVINDTIYSQNGILKLAEMQAFYQVEKKEQQLKILNQEKKSQEDEIEIQLARIRQQNTIIIASVTITLLALIAGFIGYRYNKEKSIANRNLKKLNHEIQEQKEEIQVQSEELMEANQLIGIINKDLESEIEKRTGELTQAYKELDTFFYRSSHDFRRPITTFLGLAEVAKISVKDLHALELFEMVKDTAHNLDKMLIKLQSISELGGQHLAYKQVLFQELLMEVVDNFREEVISRGIVMTTDVQVSKPFFSYPLLIKIIFENVIENAIHFSVKVEPQVSIRVFENQDGIIVEVKDNGEGIRHEYANRIFEMYFRASEHSKGNGLGLYIVKKVVQRLGGTIQFESTYGTGAMFAIWLPKSS